MRSLALASCLLLATLAGCLGEEPKAAQGEELGADVTDDGLVPGSAISRSTFPPVAGLEVQAAIGKAPFTAVFTVTGRDPDGNPLAWTLDTDGDGVLDWRTVAPAVFPAQATHTYHVPGDYTARLTVTDGTHVGVAEAKVRVTSPRLEAMSCSLATPDGFGSQDPVSNHRPAAAVRGNVSEGKVPFNITLTLDGFDVDRDLVGWELDLDGDLRCDASCVSPCPLPLLFRHAYNRTGVHNVTFVVTDGVEYAKATFQVKALPPDPPKRQDSVATKEETTQEQAEEEDPEYR